MTSFRIILGWHPSATELLHNPRITDCEIITLRQIITTIIFMPNHSHNFLKHNLLCCSIFSANIIVTQLDFTAHVT